MGCAILPLKLTVFIFNAICALAGIGLIVLGVCTKLQVDFDTINNEEFTPFTYGPIFAITLGCVVFIIAFLGCCGALRESSTLLFIYSSIMIIILVLHVALGVFAFIQANGDEFDKKVYNVYDDIFKKAENGNKLLKDYISTTEAGLKCCGVKSYLDYVITDPLAIMKLPASCCKNEDKNCSTLSTDLYRGGCGGKFVDFVRTLINANGIVAIVFAAIELVCVIIGLCLSNTYKNENRRRNYA